MLNFFIYFLTAVLVLVCLLTVLIVLMQRPKQEGLGAAFGAGVTDQMWGAQTTNVLQRGTVYLAVLFFVITLLLAVLVNAQQKGTRGTLNELTESTETDGAADTTPGLSDSDPGLDFSPSTTTTPNFDDIQLNPDGGGAPDGAIPIPLTELPGTEGTETPKPGAGATDAIEEVKEAAEEVKEGAAGAIEGAAEAVEGAVEAVEGAAEGAVEAVEGAAEGAIEAVEEAVEAPKPE